MRQTQFKEVIILSAEHSDNNHGLNHFYSDSLERQLTNYDFIFNEALGCYKKSSESSFVVIPRNNEDIDKLKEIAFKEYNQESILYQDKSGDAFLIYSCGKKEAIGQLRKVQSNKGLENYTIMNGEIYSTNS